MDDGANDAAAARRQELTLAATVQRLRLEVEALRRSAHAGAAVEQAKGLLAERYGCGVEEAYDHLLSLAADAGVDPAEAAALLLGTPLLPDAVRPDDAGLPPANVFDPAAYLSTSLKDGTLGAVLDTIHGPAALLSPLRDEAGHVTDFLVDAINSDASDKPGDRPGTIVGRRLLESYPGLVLSDLLQDYARVLETGVSLRRAAREYAGLDRGRVLPTTMSVRACRVGDGLLVSWRFHDEKGDLSAQLDQAQRLGNLGWGEWDVVTGEAVWSDQLYVIFGRDRSAGPLPLEELAAFVHPGDLSQAEHLMRVLLGRREPADLEMRIQVTRAGSSRQPRRELTRHVRVMAEPVLDASGEPIRLRCVFQDVTSRRRAERLLADSRRELEQSRRRAAEDRHTAVELQRAILPLPRRPLDLPGMRVAVCYLPAESDTRVGGDWYEAAELPGGKVFLAIGDVSGHGLPAAAAMAELRNALSGLAFTGAPPDRLLGWLNRLVLHRRQPLTASGIAGLFDPVTRTLTWAQAGHPPPVLVRAGTAELVDQPEGLLLGAVDDPRFATGTLGLLPGDLLLFYTDGLIERRRRDLTTGLARLVEASAGLAKQDPDPEAAVAHVLAALDAPHPDDDTCVIAVQIL